MRQDGCPEVAVESPLQPAEYNRIDGGHDNADETLLGVRQAKQQAGNNNRQDNAGRTFPEQSAQSSHHEATIGKFLTYCGERPRENEYREELSHVALQAGEAAVVDRLSGHTVHNRHNDADIEQLHEDSGDEGKTRHTKPRFRLLEPHRRDAFAAYDQRDGHQCEKD